MCDFCRKFDFGNASTDIDKYGASIILAAGSFRFPAERQFNYCPVCGCKRDAVKFEKEREERDEHYFGSL